MATASPAFDLPRQKVDFDVRQQVWTALRYLGSLKLTVFLFAVSMVLVFVGTLAQDDMNMLAVKNRYFVTWIAWLHFDDLFPQAFFPHDNPIPGVLPFLGGKTVGVLLFVNLIAAKITRFKITGRGSSLATGWLMLAVGSVLTLVIAMTGHSSDGLQGEPPAWLSYDVLWGLTLGTATAVTLGLGYYAGTHENKLTRVIGLVSAAALGLLIAWALFGGRRIDDSGLRIVWQLTKGLGAGLVLLIGCVMVFGKQGGNVLLHIGVGLLMVGQFVFGDRQLEQRLSLIEGQSTNTLMNLDEVELTFAREIDGQRNVVAVPGERLIAASRSGETITDATLPVDVRVVRYFANSNLADPDKPNDAPEMDNPVGAAATLAVSERTTAGGADGEVNVPSAYVELSEKGGGASLGTFLVSQWINDRAALIPTDRVGDKDDVVEAGGEKYSVGLRFRREVKPYWVQLEDVRRINYSGTETPRDYSSYVRIVDTETGDDRRDRIWMNNPLRYRGETFYQSSYSPLPDGRELTGIQVVRNSGWLVPYLACSITALGMGAHFLGTLSRFVSRRQREDRKRRVATGRGPKIIASVSLAAAVGIAVAMLVPWSVGDEAAKLKAFDFYGAGQIPVKAGGRVMPLDAYARNSVKTISNKESIRLDDAAPKGLATRAGGKKLSAMGWLMEVAIDSPDVEELRMFRIDNDEVLSELDLERRKSHLYSLAEMRPKLGVMQDAIEQARKKERNDLTTKERKMIELNQRLNQFFVDAAGFRLPVPREIPPSLLEKIMPNADERTAKLFALRELQRRMDALGDSRAAGFVPPTGSEALVDDPDWRPFAPAFFDHSLATAGGDATAPPGVDEFAEMIAAYRDDARDPVEFNLAVEKHLEGVAAVTSSDYDASRVGMERWMRDRSPTLVASVLYLVGILAGIVFLFRGTESTRLSALAFVSVAFVVHTLALYVRMRITGRAPVINLYSSAVFIGWGAVLFGLAVEGVFRQGIGSFLASFAGAASIQVAYGLNTGGEDTMPVLQAVLDTQFWLATHVVSVTLGYVATLVAGFLGIGYLALTWLNRGDDWRRTIYRSLYGSLCFGILFSFVGTVLGGLWADDSWGRFWGWDPKENGALLIVIWVALMLHARWDGMVGPRGLASLAVLGNIVTAWSWFGTNELQVGLHSYGFTEGMLRNLSIFAVAMIGVVVVDGVMRAVADRRTVEPGV